MRLPLLAMLFALNAIAAFAPIPAVGAASSNFSVSSVTVQAGADATFTVVRSNAGKGVYALVQTSDSSAHVGPDYVAVKQLLYFKGGELAKTVTVHTVVDQAAAGATLTFNIGIAAGATDIAWGRGSIVEPAPNPQPATWVSAPLTDGGFARCKVAGGCHSTSAPCPYTTGLNPPAVCPVPDIIAQQGEVRAYAWGGYNDGGRGAPYGSQVLVQYDPRYNVGNFWPVGHYPKTSSVASDWFLGLSGWEDEWEGVAPAP